MQEEPGYTPGVLWAYVYEIVPPLAEHRLDGVRTILERESEVGAGGTDRWTGRLVLERDVTFILVVCDSPGPNEAAELALAHELARLQAMYVRGMPVAIQARDEDEP